jgi:hypothetical protein
VAVPSVGGWFDHPLASVVGYRPRYEVGYLDFHNHLDCAAVPNRKLRACDKRIPGFSSRIGKLAEREGFSSVFRSEIDGIAMHADIVTFE